MLSNVRGRLNNDPGNDRVRILARLQPPSRADLPHKMQVYAKGPCQSRHQVFFRSISTGDPVGPMGSFVRSGVGSTV